MITSFLKLTARNLLKHKTFSLINISGLAIGFACTIIISLWVYDELSFDKFHKNNKHLLLH